MLRCTLLLLCLCPALLAAATPEDDLAYSLGARLGERLRSEVPDLQLEAMLEGLRQAYRAQPLRLPQERIDSLLEEHEKHLALRAAASRHEQARATEQRFLAAEKAKTGVRELAGGVLVQELQPGSAERFGNATRVQVRYRGELADGTLFDQSEGAQWFRLNSLIVGWQTALRAMPVGAKWRVVIPAAQAYGQAGAGDLIPPDAPLVFELELLDIAD